VAYVSDAGTPSVSDPGAALVAAVRSAGHACVPLPGASSVVAALSVAGDAAADGFAFVGFAPTKANERRLWLDALAKRSRESVVLFETPHRIAALLAALAEAMPARTVTIARELTKQFESVHSLVARDAPAWLAADANRSRGEFVLVLHAQRGEAAPVLDTEGERVLSLLLGELPLKQAVALAASISGAPRNALYQRALVLRGDPSS
jgi:16S rRNA (cytidine1402-2'-O)-methyltransferase